MDMIEAMARGLAQQYADMVLHPRAVKKYVDENWDEYVPEASHLAQAAEPFIQARIDEAGDYRKGEA